MKVEYLSNGADNCPLIRLYDFNQAEAKRLKEIVSSLVVGDRQSIALEKEVWVEPAGPSRLLLRRGERDEGVRQVSPTNFECILSSDGWANIEGLLEPFCRQGVSGFQWLTRHGRVPILISSTGQW